MAFSITTVQSVRETVSNFCKEREWEKFHLPMSIALALAGTYQT
jgi:hypothetical protein